MADNSPAFQRWVASREQTSPGGTAEQKVFRPSLSGLMPDDATPSVETLGYSRLSLRDKSRAAQNLRRAGIRGEQFLRVIRFKTANLSCFCVGTALAPSNQ